MLDLKKLEEKLDKALAQETEESLTNWLLAKRNYNTFIESLGEGNFDKLNNILIKSETILGPDDINISKPEFQEMPSNPDYPIAA
ncbi:MAG: hypothetical protein LC100_12295 [Chitinophagales bacterium]|nr:hypothetical protein [Chitinophagales bacterium]